MTNSSINLLASTKFIPGQKRTNSVSTANYLDHTRCMNILICPDPAAVVVAFVVEARRAAPRCTWSALPPSADQ